MIHSIRLPLLRPHLRPMKIVVVASGIGDVVVRRPTLL